MDLVNKQVHQLNTDVITEPKKPMPWAQRVLPAAGALAVVSLSNANAALDISAVTDVFASVLIAAATLGVAYLGILASIKGYQIIRKAF